MKIYILDDRQAHAAYAQQSLCGLIYCEQHAPKEAEQVHPSHINKLHLAMGVAPGSPISCCCCDTVVVPDTRELCPDCERDTSNDDQHTSFEETGCTVCGF